MSNSFPKSLSNNKAKILISYDHKDVKWKDMLLKQLEVLAIENEISLWTDNQIEEGDD